MGIIIHINDDGSETIYAGTSGTEVKVTPQSWTPEQKATARQNIGAMSPNEMPTSFPANGGNADTVGGKSASDFVSAVYGTVKEALGVQSDYSNTYRTQLTQYNNATYLANVKDENNQTKITIQPNALLYEKIENGVTKTSTILHTGNSNPVAIQESAPTDTNALWVW